MTAPATQTVTEPKVTRTVVETAHWAEELRCARKRIALVPTMGYLHEGHLSLMREARKHADVVAASIFVNPTQFGPKEDLTRYPRDFDGDVAKCAAAGVELVFAPEPSVIYPPGYQTYVDVLELQRGLCGERRPGHFRGVATVVIKLFNIFRPHVAFFGEKDYQQLRVIKVLARDLNLGVEVIGLATVREPDGLAMSSRNAFLSGEERHRALALSRGLRSAQTLFAEGTVQARELVTAVRKELEVSHVREDYVELVDAETLSPVVEVTLARPSRLLVAGFLGSTRLIDNMAIGG